MPSCSEIIELLKPISFAGNSDAEVKEIVQLGKNDMHEHALVWCADKNKEQLVTIQSGTALISNTSYEWLQKHTHSKSVNWIVVDHPRKAFLKTIRAFFYEADQKHVIQDSAKIDSSVKLDKQQVSIGHHVSIEKNCELGTNVRIGHNTVILANTIIGNDVVIGNNCTIGGIGFGYERNDDGEFELIPHIGNVVIENSVEIGNNTVIDRAVLGATHIGKNVKIDNLVHIAHGVTIGENSLIIANSMIAGSVTIGQNVWIGPSTSTIQNIQIGDNSLTGVATNVLKNVEPNSVMAGNPAKKLR